ncbi:ABC transporter ATP-binding protein [Irregularibacter muris]|uniref:ABC transporter ATP-binding protein n=1 Tax=Irregularibacter muris TaxID=1796619 RepID=A0AAE3HDN9_9FIRM|nr:ABC transporter ATP-binding protein [Irregularibacter muris]MCR1897414.1 ABC transporter ATP-binding protein [Irregularibacter muris]
MYAIEVQKVQKLYKNGVQALNGLNLNVKTGEIFSLLGQNGAGKSTLISILTTYLKLNSGKITMLGKDIGKDSEEIRSAIACVAQRVSMDTHLSLKENMMFQAGLYKIPKSEARQRMSMLIEEFELNPYLKYPVLSYSGGIKRRLDIALNMMSNPKILFLDEPTVGMDIQSRMTMGKMMRKIRDDFGMTIFFTTHYLEEADNLSDTICIIKDGKEIVQGTPFELRKYIRQDAIKIQFSNNEQAKTALSVLTEHFTPLMCTLHNDSILIDTNSSQRDFIKVNEFLLKSQISFQGIEITEPTLEDVFLRLTEKRED